MMDILWWIGQTIFLLVIFQLVFTTVVFSVSANRWIMLPIFACVGGVAALVMIWMEYIPFTLFFVWCALNKYYISYIFTEKFAEEAGYIPNKKMFYISTYSYIVIACVGAWILQVEVSGSATGDFIPLWKHLLG